MEILSRAAQHSYPVKQVDGKAGSLLTSPDGYKFYVIEQPSASSDPVQSVELNVSNLQASRKYWHELLQMQLLDESEKSLRFSYGGKQAALQITQIADPLDRAKAYGRIAFAIPSAKQPPLHEAVKAAGGAILKPLITLDTPGKATVSVLILGDPDGHEICFVDEEGFGELSQVEPDGDERLDKNIEKDPFQKK